MHEMAQKYRARGDVKGFQDYMKNDYQPNREVIVTALVGCSK
jgi:hypothetical protein